MKVRTLSLGTGYAEDSSWAQLILVHPKGFKTVQEALCSVYDALEAMLLEDDHFYPEQVNKDLTMSERVEEALHTIIHGSFQDHGSFWEHISQRFWLAGLAWTSVDATKYPIVGVNNAPQMVVAAKTGHLVEGTVIEFQDGWATSSYFEIPKGVKLFNKKPKKEVPND